MPKSTKSTRGARPASREIVDQLSKQQPKDDAEYLRTLSLNDPEGRDEPAPAAIENDRGVQDRYGWVP